MIRSRSNWDVGTLKEYVEALRAADQRALQIKETADERALLLQAETQKYKDEKANDLRSQIERERGGYATKNELAALADKVGVALRPLSDFVAAQTSRTATNIDWRTGIYALITIAAVLIVRFT
jgi:hypothetical protein